MSHRSLIAGLFSSALIAIAAPTIEAETWPLGDYPNPSDRFFPVPSPNEPTIINIEIDSAFLKEIRKLRSINEIAVGETPTARPAVPAVPADDVVPPPDAAPEPGDGAIVKDAKKPAEKPLDLGQPATAPLLARLEKDLKEGDLKRRERPRPSRQRTSGGSSASSRPTTSPTW